MASARFRAGWGEYRSRGRFEHLRAQVDQKAPAVARSRLWVDFELASYGGDDAFDVRLLCALDVANNAATGFVERNEQFPRRVHHDTIGVIDGTEGQVTVGERRLERVDDGLQVVVVQGCAKPLGPFGDRVRDTARRRGWCDRPASGAGAG